MVLKVGWLPKGPNGEKWGADEALANGKTVEDLESYCHPVTGNEERYLDWPVLGEEALVEAMGRALDAVTAEDTQGFIEHCGYRFSAQPL